MMLRVYVHYFVISPTRCSGTPLENAQQSAAQLYSMGTAHSAVVELMPTAICLLRRNVL
jgi:hypothetical protein